MSDQNYSFLWDLQTLSWFIFSLLAFTVFFALYFKTDLLFNHRVLVNYILGISYLGILLFSVFSGIIHLYYRRIKEAIVSVAASIVPFVPVYFIMTKFDIENSNNIAMTVVTEVGVSPWGADPGQFYSEYWFISGIAITIMIFAITAIFGVFSWRYLKKYAFTPLITLILIFSVLQVGFVISFSPIVQDYDSPSYSEFSKGPLTETISSYWRVPPPLHHSIVKNSIYNKQVYLQQFLENRRDDLNTNLSRKKTICGGNLDEEYENDFSSIKNSLGHWRRDLDYLERLKKSNYSNLKSEEIELMMKRKKDIDKMVKHHKNLYGYYSERFDVRKEIANTPLIDRCSFPSNDKEKLRVESYTCGKNGFRLEMKNIGKNPINESFAFRGGYGPKDRPVKLEKEDYSFFSIYVPREEQRIVSREYELFTNEIKTNNSLDLNFENPHIGFKFTCQIENPKNNITNSNVQESDDE